MFRRGGFISRSFHTPRGVTINDVGRGESSKRKVSWSSSKVQVVRNAVSEVAITPHRPVVIKEGYLTKPSFFRFGGRKRRWCVLQTYSETEASIDVYMDDTKSRYKGSISLDRDASPILVVKNFDANKKKSSKCYFMIKTGKTTHQFTTETQAELREWCAMLRQALDNGMVFSGKINEPFSLAQEGMVNVKFNSNCIALLCPIKENPIKTWRLDHITSFGQCGGTITFECCSHCCESSCTRCSINIVQENPVTILSIIERAIKSNPNTGDFNYERSILGDICHFNHQCSKGRLLPAYSDTNIFRSSLSPPKSTFTVPVELHSKEFVDFNPTTGTMDSNDSGLPGTPQTDESLSINSSISSPTGTNANVTNRFRSISDTRVFAQSEPLPPPPGIRNRRRSDETPSSPLAQRKGSNSNRLLYATINHQLIGSKDNSKPANTAPVTYTTVQHAENGGQTQLLDDDESIYDEPNCEHMESVSPSHSYISRSRVNSARSSSSSPSHRIHTSPTNHYNVHSLPKRRKATSPNGTCHSVAQSPLKMPSNAFSYIKGSDQRDRYEDYDEPPPPVPKHRKKPGVAPPPSTSDAALPLCRGRLRSCSDVLDRGVAGPSLLDQRSRFMGPGSVDQLDRVGQPNGPDRHLKGSTDLLAKLHEEEKKLTTILESTRRPSVVSQAYAYSQKNAERERRAAARKFLTLDELDKEDEVDSDTAMETCSNLVEYHMSRDSPPMDKVLTKVASNTVRGYAYKINIPVANAQYDVPRRLAPIPDLEKIPENAPPKPCRYTPEELAY